MEPGKTVLTEILAGINKPDSGIIRYNFKFNKSFHECIGIQFQDSNYPFGLKCKDIIEFFLKVNHMQMDKIELDLLLEEFGITNFYNKNASSLSGGQQQRLNLLLSIIHKPKLVFLDELSTGLDIKIRTNIKKFIKEYAFKHNMTLVIVSHDMDEVQYLCEDIILLEHGTIKDINTTSNIVKQYGSLDKYVQKNL